LLNAELYINGEIVKEFNDNSFSFLTELEQGINNFVIKATTTQNKISIRHGDITLDSEGPSAEIEIE